MFKLILEKIKRPTRRVTVIETLDSRKIINHMMGAIYIFQLQGKQYFTQTMVKTYLNEQIGWPKLNDPQSSRLFNNLFDQAVSGYLPSPKVRGGFSFTLKPSPSSQFTDKVLKS